MSLNYLGREKSINTIINTKFTYRRRNRRSFKRISAILEWIDKKESERLLESSQTKIININNIKKSIFHVSNNI